MILFKKTNDILPILLCLFGLFIVYSFPLYTPVRLAALDYHNAFAILSLKNDIFKNYADIFNRSVICTMLVYIVFLYYRYLTSMTFIVSGLLLSNSIFYMAILANIIEIPNIDFFLSSLLAMCLWHSYFLSQKTVFNFIISAIILSGIACINPVFSIYLSASLIISTLVTHICNKNQDNYFYSTLILVLCGFCSFTFSLLATKTIDDVTALLQNQYQFPMITSIFLSLIIIFQYLSQKPFIAELSYNKKNTLISYGLLTFLGATFIGRFDYIAHFM